VPIPSCSPLAAPAAMDIPVRTWRAAGKDGVFRMWDQEQLSICLGASRKPDDSYQKAEELLLKYANRHGIVTGATGTGKTVTLQILAEGFSSAGVPVFCADIKGDLAGVAMMGEPKDFLL